MHIELRRWADVLVIAPLSANTLAKLAHGLSDNLVTCVARAWDFRMPFVVSIDALMPCTSFYGARRPGQEEPGLGQGACLPSNILPAHSLLLA